MAEIPKARDFFESSRAAVGDHELRRKLENASARHLDHFAKVKAEFPAYDDERDAAYRIKTDAIAHLDELLIELTSKLEARGCKVFFAEDAAAARDYIVELAKAKGAKHVVKGKSMTTEEIELNGALARAGIDAVETDLGEYIVQLRGERPSHIITPAIHLSKEEIGQLFTDNFGIEYTAEPEEITAEARSRLRAIFLAADFGVTGVNFAIAETGTIVIVENEGNGRLSSTMPETFVAVMGIEKVIPRLEDLSHFLEILARTATGQKITSYTSFITGPRREGELDGPGEMHVVILDNGRSSMIADPVIARGVELHPMRRVPERMPDLPANRRPRVSLGLSGADRIDRQPQFIRRRRGIPAVCVHAVRRVQGYLPGEDRHPANPAPFALEGERRRASAPMAARDRAGAAGRAAVCADGAVSADGSGAWKIRRDDAETIGAQWLSPPDAGAVRQLDQVSRLPAAAASPPTRARAGAPAGLNVAEIHKIIASVKDALGVGAREYRARCGRERGGAGRRVGSSRRARIGVRPRARRGGRGVPRNTHSIRSD